MRKKDKIYKNKPKFISKADRELRNEIMEDYIVGEQNLIMGLDAFEGKSIIEKINEWTDTWNGRPYFNTGMDDEIRYLHKVARAQLKNQLATINQANIRAEYIASGNDGMISKIISEVYQVASDYFKNKMGKKALTLKSMLTAGIEGTSIEEVSIEKQSVYGDVVDEFDPETGAYSLKQEAKVIFNGPKITLHRVHDFLIANPFEEDVQKQEFVILRKTITYGEFMARYKGYPKSELVEGGAYFFGDDTGKTDNADNAGDISFETSIEKGEVEIIRYFRKRDNLYAIVANGQILYQGPIISRKLNYPFAIRIHEPVDGSSLFWGSSFMEAIGDEQGLLTVNRNLLTKKQMWAANPTLLTESEEDYWENEKLEIGIMNKVDSTQTTRLLEFPGISPGDNSYHGMLREELQNNSNQAQGGGGVIGGTGGVGTARQVVTAQEQAMRVIGLNSTFLEETERKIEMLMLDIIREFLTTPELQMITKADGELVEKASYERTIKARDIKLYKGKKGTVMIHFYKKSDYFDANGNAKKNKKRKFNKEQNTNAWEEGSDEKIAELESVVANQAQRAKSMKEPMDIMYVPVEVFDEFDYDVSIVPGSSTVENKMLELDKRERFIQSITPFLGESIDGAQIADFLGEVYGYNPEDFIADTEQVSPEQLAQQQAEQFDPYEEGSVVDEIIK